jgi:aryl-alcohol dehydrogenase-like predicted oxidoreductase
LKYINENRFSLGTVKFGMSYGVGVMHSQVPTETVKNIVEAAWLSGCRTIDTAMNYGQSEQLLGGIGVNKWKIYSKLPGMPELSSAIFDWVHNKIVTSLSNLKVKKLHGLLLHRPQDLFSHNGDDLYNALLRIKALGLVDKIGVSIYDPSELELITTNFTFDIVQAPLNIIDRRLLKSGWLSRLHKMGVEVHVRSVFLQGVLLMSSAERPEYFQQWNSLWEKWDKWLLVNNLSPLQACLGFLYDLKEIKRIVVGADTPGQFIQVVDNLICAISPPELFSSNDLRLINPSLWSHK